MQNHISRFGSRHLPCLGALVAQELAKSLAELTVGIGRLQAPGRVLAPLRKLTRSSKCNSSEDSCSCKPCRVSTSSSDKDLLKVESRCSSVSYASLCALPHVGKPAGSLAASSLPKPHASKTPWERAKRLIEIPWGLRS